MLFFEIYLCVCVWNKKKWLCAAMVIESQFGHSENLSCRAVAENVRQRQRGYQRGKPQNTKLLLRGRSVHRNNNTNEAPKWVRTPSHLAREQDAKKQGPQQNPKTNETCARFTTVGCVISPSAIIRAHHVCLVSNQLPIVSLRSWNSTK